MPFIGRKEHFGSLIYDRRRYRYLPLDEFGTRLLQDSLSFSPEELYEHQGFHRVTTRENFFQTLSLFREEGLLDDRFRFRGSFISQPDPLEVPVEVGRKFLSAPLRINLAITQACPLRCKHCINASGKRGPDELSSQDLVSLVDQMAALGIWGLSIGGGEPFARKDLLDILDHASRRLVHTELVTNGILITKEKAKKLARLSLKSLGVSVDGSSEEINDAIRGKGAFKKALRGIQFLKEEGCKNVVLRVTTTRSVLSELKSFRSLAEKIGCDEVRFKVPVFHGRIGENDSLMPTYDECKQAFELLSEEFGGNGPSVSFPVESRNLLEHTGLFSNFGCSAGQVRAYLDSLGNLYPCSLLGEEKMCAGNIRHRGLKEMWDHGESFRFFRRFAGNDFCFSCADYLKCRGGCRYRAYLASQDVNAPDPWCHQLQGTPR
ncbi:MAG: radical SAM protein [Armatimonadetes bacterium]|nr:radical SAM protein [Armatimonadota bacterium]